MSAYGSRPQQPERQIWVEAAAQFALPRLVTQIAPHGADDTHIVLSPLQCRERLALLVPRQQLRSWTTALRVST